RSSGRVADISLKGPTDVASRASPLGDHAKWSTLPWIEQAMLGSCRRPYDSLAPSHQEKGDPPPVRCPRRFPHKSAPSHKLPPRIDFFSGLRKPVKRWTLLQSRMLL